MVLLPDNLNSNCMYIRHERKTRVLLLFNIMKNQEYYRSRCDRKVRCEYIKSRMITTKAKERENGRTVRY